MGYVREKYTATYFLKKDGRGNATSFGVEGQPEFERGDIRKQDKEILKRLDFRGKAVLEFGYGRGEAIKYAIECGADKVVGVDFSEDAFNIARVFLNEYGLKAELFCEDALVFLKDYINDSANTLFDIVLMLDFVEHVPRTELTDILGYLHRLLSERAVIALNTPVFRVDNDVVAEGLKPEARDTSDEYQETAGMHCNRYTKKSLSGFMKECGFESISGHFYIPVSLLSQQLVREGDLIYSDLHVWTRAFQKGYPILPSWMPEEYDYAYVPDYNPEWHIIGDGVLKGRSIYIDPRDGYWQQEMIAGNFDNFFYAYLSQFNLEGNVVADIGAHIGYHSMQFAQLVGKSGIVYSFEPNIFNQERMTLILSKNPDLAERIKLYNVAVSDAGGETEFSFASEVDSGKSSGSFIHNAHTPFQRREYAGLGFEAVNVRTVNLDQFFSALDKNVIPNLLKIDVEGSEHLVLKGAINILRNFRPILLIEIHSIYCMLKVTEFLNSLDYRIDLLKEEIDGRCFIAAISFGERDASGKEESYYLQRYYQIQKSHLLLQQEYSYLQDEHRQLNQEHKALQREHKTLQQTRAVVLVKKLGEYPLLIKSAEAVYKTFYTVYKLLRRDKI